MARGFGADPDEVAADAFSAVLRAIRNGKGPTDSFRAYLFASVRNSAIRLVNAQRRLSPLNSEEDAARYNLATELERDPVDGTHVRDVFSALPERWRQVLWYTEIEQFSPVETARVMGIAPNAVSALAMRARRGLRKSWINGYRAKLPADAECRTTLDHLESRILNLPVVDYDPVHVRGCSFCESLLEESRTVSSALIAAVLPGIVGVGAAAAYVSSVAEGATALSAPVAASATAALADAIGSPDVTFASDTMPVPSAQPLALSSFAGAAQATLVGVALVGGVVLAGVVATHALSASTSTESITDTASAALSSVPSTTPRVPRPTPTPSATVTPVPPAEVPSTIAPQPTPDPVDEPAPVAPPAPPAPDPAPERRTPPPVPVESPAPTLTVDSAADSRYFPRVLLSGEPKIVDIQYQPADGSDAPWTVLLGSFEGSDESFPLELPVGEWTVRAVSAAAVPGEPVRVTVGPPPSVSVTGGGEEWVLAISGVAGANVEVESGGSTSSVTLDSGGHSTTSSAGAVRARYSDGVNVGPWSALAIPEL